MSELTGRCDPKAVDTVVVDGTVYQCVTTSAWHPVEHRIGRGNSPGDGVIILAVVFVIFFVGFIWNTVSREAGNPD